jgi:invasion protein IalB
MRPISRWHHRQTVCWLALLAWLGLSAAPALTAIAIMPLAESEPPASDPSTGQQGWQIRCDAECLEQLREQLLEQHRRTAPIWML